MKKIEAYIRQEKLNDVLNALEELGYPGVSIWETRGYGKQRGQREEWHGQYQDHQFQQKLRLDIIVEDKQLNPILNAITNAAHTGEYGDGKIFVTEVQDALRIRTKQRGEVSLQ